MRIVLLGAPGSGKGTQARLLEERYRVPQISTGDLLREAVAANNALGKKAKKKMDAGELVPDELVFELIRERLNRKDARRGAVLDGFPRSIPQAQKLDGLLSMVGQPVQVAVLVEVDDESLVKRLTGRRTCSKCGGIYNIHFSPPEKSGVCDACAGKLTVRNDDKESTVRNRLQIYHEQTEPLITYYRAQHKLRTVKATGEIGAIHNKICDILDLEIRPLEIKTLEIAAESHDEESGTVIAGGKVTKNVTLKKKKPPRRRTVSAAKQATAKPAATGTKTTGGRSAKKPAVRRKPAAAATAKKSIPGKTTTTRKKVAAKKQTAKKPVAKKVPAKKPRALAKKSAEGEKAAALTTPKAAKKKVAPSKAVPKKKTSAKTTAKGSNAAVESKPVTPKKSVEKKSPAKTKAALKKPKKAVKKGGKKK